MYLKRLELQGFKSFPNKIKLDFNKGITAVVGPNGSGKSNVSDAITWVLGEQSAKNLRGSKMEDIIFAGTDTRKPMSFCEVTMVIDNEERLLKYDTSEVAVTRKVYRTGESEYLINNKQCRLKDIHELFMDTGIGRDGYSIISQGKIDDIISSKASDRRTLFEEAVGIVKYKNRKIEAESKLKRERDNLSRVNDIISEIETQIEPIRQQSEVAKQYLELEKEEKEVNVNLFVLQVDEYNKTLEQLKSDIKNIDEHVEFLNKKIININDTKEQIKLNKIKYEDELQKLNDEKITIKVKIESLNNTLAFTNQQINDIKHNIQTAKDNIVLMQNTNSRLLVDNNQLKLKKESVQSVNKNLTEQLEKIEEELGYITDTLGDSENYLNSLTHKLSDANYNKSNKKLIVETSKNDVNNIDNKIESNLEQISVLKSRQNELNIKKMATQKSLNEKNQQCTDVDNNIKSQNEYINKLVIEKRNIETNKRELENKYTKINSEYKILNELEKNNDGYYNSVKTILNNKHKLNGIVDVVANVVHVNPEYETAIETALGASIQHIITKDEYSAKDAINYLKVNNKGRATFLPISVIKSRYLNINLSKYNNAKIYGIASDLVHYDDYLGNIVRNLLGNVVIVEDMDTAIMLAKDTNNSFRIVTVEGDVINAGGSMSGGSVGSKSTKVFSRKREINNLYEEMYKLKQNLENIDKEFVDISEKLLVQENNKSENVVMYNSYTLEINEYVNVIKNIDESISENQYGQNSKSEEVEKLNKDRDVLKEKIVVAEKELEQLQKEIEETEKSLAKFNAETTANRSTKDEKNQQLFELKMKIANNENESNNINNNIQTNIHEINRNEETINGILKDIERSNLEIDNKTNSIENIKIQINSMTNTEKNQESIQKEIVAKNVALTEKLEKLDEESQNIFSEINNNSNSRTKIEIRVTTTEEKQTELFNYMWDKYELTYVEACAYDKQDNNIYSLIAKQKEIAKLIKALGIVNINAIEQYLAISERYMFLTSQRNDIVEAEKFLLELIDELVKQMELQFNDQFKLISDNFEFVFKEIFGGGNAKLVLTDSDNVLESGIEIKAQPPGKKLDNMTLLSGGEKALTATALLFAILKLKPSPFCILDEIEASLDDANVNKFANYLKKYSDKTQFVVITHRKGTMECADVLYGITMQEKGVSTLVSVEF